MDIPFKLNKLVSILSFRRLLIYTLITTCAFYFGSFNYSIFSFKSASDLFENYTILKFIGISLIIRITFYDLIDFLLRLLFHRYTKNKFLKIRNELLKAGRFSYLKGMHSLYGIFKIIFKDYIYPLGFLTKKDLIEDGESKITDIEKEELLNEMLNDCYKWICIIIHLLFTLIFIWRYINLWVILASAVALLFLLLTPIAAIFVVLNIDLLNKVRLDILKSKHF